MKVGVAKETAPGERRVALVPEVLGKLKAAGLEILVERGAGAGSSIPDAAYEEVGATIVRRVGAAEAPGQSGRGIGTGAISGDVARGPVASASQP